MKKNFWLIIGILIATTLRADQPAAPARPAAQKSSAAAAASARKAAAELRTVPLVAGPAVVAVSPVGRVNVRGQARLKSEIITHMTNGEPVTVIEEIQLASSKPDEPSAWAKIVLPAKVHPWVNAKYIDPANMTVKPKKLNLRGGPGENYSILGTLQAGDTVKEVSRKENWIEVEITGTAYAFMAAQYLKQETGATPAVTSTEPATTTTTVTEPAAVAMTTTETPVETAATTPTTTTESAMTSTNEPVETTPPVDEPPPPRIVQREGIVRGTISIQAPTNYELISPDNRRPINYLYTTAPALDLSRYKGLHIIVSGEEALDRRWKNTPVLTIQSIRVVD